MGSRWRTAALVVAATMLAPLAARGADDAAMKRGEYVFTVADCAGCHTDAKNKGKRLAGGRPLATAFGIFVTPNITPDRQHGIGNWTLADLMRALRRGIAPQGHYYYPVFPYASFTGMTDRDIADLYLYLMAQEPVAQPNQPHQVKFPFNVRSLLVGWRTLFFNEGPLAAVAGKDAAWNRGHYLASALAHCGECHTPRNLLGAMQESRALSGNPDGPDGQKAPNITPDPESGIGKWSEEDLATLLKTGQLPNFDFVGAGMAEVVKGTAALTEGDLAALTAYLRSLPPIRTETKKK